MPHISLRQPSITTPNNRRATPEQHLIDFGSRLEYEEHPIMGRSIRGIDGLAATQEQGLHFFLRCRRTGRLFIPVLAERQGNLVANNRGQHYALGANAFFVPEGFDVEWVLVNSHADVDVNIPRGMLLAITPDMLTSQAREQIMEGTFVIPEYSQKQMVRMLSANTQNPEQAYATISVKTNEAAQLKLYMLTKAIDRQANFYSQVLVSQKASDESFEQKIKKNAESQKIDSAEYYFDTREIDYSQINGPEKLQKKMQTIQTTAQPIFVNTIQASKQKVAGPENLLEAFLGATNNSLNHNTNGRKRKANPANKNYVSFSCLFQTTMLPAQKLMQEKQREPTIILAQKSRARNAAEKTASAYKNTFRVSLQTASSIHSTAAQVPSNSLRKQTKIEAQTLSQNQVYIREANASPIVLQEPLGAALEIKSKVSATQIRKKAEKKKGKEKRIVLQAARKIRVRKKRKGLKKIIVAIQRQAKKPALAQKIIQERKAVQIKKVEEKKKAKTESKKKKVSSLKKSLAKKISRWFK